MRLIRKLFLILLLFSCKKNNNYSSIQVIGHAGMGLEMSNSIYHNNSKEAIELALSMTGSNGVEIDVQQDLDGILWLFHDETLDKTTNSTGCIAEKKTTELENIHYSSLHKEKLRKLAEIDFDKFTDKIIFLDVKFWNACSENYASTSDIKNALKLINFENKENVYLIIPNESFLDDFKTDFNVLFANDNFEIGKNILIQDSLIQGTVIRNSKINSDQVNSIRTFNRHVFLFEMRSPKGIKSALKKNPSGIISDDLRAAIIQKRN
jgi:glycerophosphoryl diester phosphodiesterase